MAKRKAKVAKKPPTKEAYEYIEATVSDGVLTLEYKVSTSKVTGSHRHDEDVSDWTDDQIRDLIIGILDVPPEEQGRIGEICWD